MCKRSQKYIIVIIWQKFVLITQNWHKAKCYFHISATFSTWLLYQIWIKINPFFSEISQQIHNMYEKLVTINQIWQRAKCYFTSMINVSYLIINTFFSQISQQTLKMYEKITIISQIWHRAKFYITCISSPCYLIMVPNTNEIYPAIVKECARMDWWTGPFPIFHDSA